MVSKKEKLELITIKLERIKRTTPMVKDMQWLVKELREAWIKEERKRK